MNYRGSLLCLVLILLLSPVAFGQDEADGEAVPAGTQYIELQPPFIANFGGVGKLRYLKAEITLRVAAGDLGAKGIRHHMPYIRHVLVMLLSRQTEEDLSSMEGRELLRQQALEEVQRVLMEEDGEQYVLDLLFSSFVVQS